MQWDRVSSLLQGSPRHAALLLGFGASALNPYMAFGIIDQLVAKKEIQLDYATAEKKYIKSICKGLFKIMSKMGISTIRSYRGAKIFEAVGLSEELSGAYFGGLKSTIGGIRLDEIARDAIAMHDAGFTSNHEEGCTRHWSLNSNQFIGKNGKVCGVEVEEVEWIPDPNGGRSTMKPTGKKKVIDADMVLLAMGFLKPEQPKFAKNVFVAGDAARGASLVVHVLSAYR